MAQGIIGVQAGVCRFSNQAIRCEHVIPWHLYIIVDFCEHQWERDGCGCAYKRGINGTVGRKQQIDHSFVVFPYWVGLSLGQGAWIAVLLCEGEP